jgi:predicted peptidase
MLSLEVEMPEAGLPWAMYRPPGYSPDRLWPLIVFLHGAGERGRDGRLQTTVGIGPALARYPDRYPALVLMPQCPASSHWGLQVDALTAMVDGVLGVEPVDRRRVYVTGTSMGGHGAVALVATDPDGYAALAPICGWADPLAVSRLRSVPTWVFHGAADDIIPVKYSREMVRALKERGIPQCTIPNTQSYGTTAGMPPIPRRRSRPGCSRSGGRNVVERAGGEIPFQTDYSATHRSTEARTPGFLGASVPRCDVLSGNTSELWV